MLNKLWLILLALIYAPYASAQVPELPSSQGQIQLSYAPLVKKIGPSVVNIYTKRTISQNYAHPFASDPFFRQFFGNNAFGNRMRKQVESSLGSGVIIEADGLVVTNAHVVDKADEITVALADGREFDAKLALSDEPSDLALLRIETKGESLPFSSLRPSETLDVGDLVLAIGNPFGVGQTVTSGIVSAQARSSLTVSDYNFFIQTDAAINPGNSGGPLVAMDGGIVGINTAIYSRSGGSLGIGFAIPSEMVATVIAAEKMGRMGDEGVIRPWLGISSQNLSADIAESLGMAKPAGALVLKLHSASPLRDAGIGVGDAILAINDHEIRDSQELKFRMATIPLGQKAKFDVVRNAKRMSVFVKAIAPPETPARNETTLEGAHPLNGARVANINPAVSYELGGLQDEQGVVVIDGNRIRAVRSGDVIVSINKIPIKTVKDAEKALRNVSPQGWLLTLKSGDQIRQVIVR